MNTQDANLKMLQTQYDEISKELKTAKKTRDAQQRIVGKAILGVIEEQADTGTCKMLLDLLHRLVVNKEDRESGMKSAAQRPLMLPDEVLRLEPGQHVCFISAKEPRLNPLLAGRRPYYARPDLAGAYLPNPDRPPFDRIKVAGRFGWSWTWKVWSHEVLPHLAGLPQYQQGMMSYAARVPLLAAARASGSPLSGPLGKMTVKLLSGY